MWDRPGELDKVSHIRITPAIRKAFDKYDVDHSGDIDMDELEPALCELGITGLDSERTKEIAERFDDNHDGTMQVEEFAALVTELENFRKAERGSVVEEDDDDWAVCSCCCFGSRVAPESPAATPRGEAPAPAPAPSQPPILIVQGSSRTAADSATRSAKEAKVAWATNVGSSPAPAAAVRKPSLFRTLSAPSDLVRSRTASVSAAREERRRVRRGEAPAAATAAARSQTFASRMAANARSSFGDLRKSFGNFRLSTVESKTQAASDSAARRGRMSSREEELRDHVRQAIDQVEGQDAEKLSQAHFAAALQQMIEDMSEDNLAAHVEPFAKIEQASNEHESLSVDEFAAYYKRFEPWARQRELLRGAGIELHAASLEVHGRRADADRLLIAATQHCAQLRSITMTGSKLHNSTITTIATQLRERLVELNFTDTRGFDDLGIKALAAYCPELAVLKVAGTLLTDAGLTPVLKNCRQIRTLEVTETEKLGACLHHVHGECDVTRKLPEQRMEEQDTHASDHDDGPTGAPGSSPFNRRKFSLQNGLDFLGGRSGALTHTVGGVASVANRVRRFSRELTHKVEDEVTHIRVRRNSRDRGQPQVPLPAPAPSGAALAARDDEQTAVEVIQS